MKLDRWNKVTHPLSPGIKLPPTGVGRSKHTWVFQVLRGPFTTTITCIASSCMTVDGEKFSGSLSFFCRCGSNSLTDCNAFIRTFLKHRFSFTSWCIRSITAGVVEIKKAAEDKSRSYICFFPAAFRTVGSFRCKNIPVSPFFGLK